MAALTPERAGAILSQLAPAVDACRSILVDHQQARTWLKDTADGHRETVSDLDLVVQDRLITAVQEIRPGASVLSEEGMHDADALDDELCFVIDPIDGTDLLIAGETGFSISIALVSAHRLVAGLLDFPARNQRFTCTLHSGAALNGRRVQIRSAPSLATARVAVSSTQRAMPSLARLWSKLGVAALVSTPGFTAKIASILVGDCDAALYLPVNPRTTFIWDYAAAALLLQEAGGRLLTLDHRPFVDTLPIEQSDGWLAAGDSLIPSVEQMVATALRNATPER